MAIELSVPGVNDAEPRELWEWLKAQIMAPDSRSRQTKVGPSDIGDACDRCLAYKMALRLPGAQPKRDEGGLKAFFGTGLHRVMEERLQEVAMGEKTGLKILSESKFDIGEIPGYGIIRGTTDALLYTSIFDWKTTDRPKLAKYRTKGVPQNYRYQMHMYGLGAHLAGHTVEWCNLIFFPRDSNDWRDIWQYVEPFNPDMARRAMRRAETIWNDWVLTGRMAELASADDCWTCRKTGGHMEITFEGEDA